MKSKRYLGTAFLLAAMVASLFAIPFFTNSANAKPKNQLVYEVKAENGTVNRELLGDPIAFVNGVPAEPVDSFVWDGVGVEPLIKGSVKVKIDPVGNTGEIKASWTDEYGDWTYKQTVFAPPHHSTGLQVGPSADSTQFIYDDPVTTNVYLHGDTTAGGPVLPTVFNYLATWGPAEVTLNGEPFENPFDGPTPLWVGHTMTTAGVRNADGQVLTVDGDIFNMMEKSNGFVDNNDMEFHLVFHEAPMPMTDNVPPPHSFFYHLTFEDVKLEIVQAE